MSVFTTVESDELKTFLTHYTVGDFIDAKAIAQGVTNTNYYLDTDSGQFVLTLYEHHSDDELDYILGLQQHLVNRGVRCSSPVTDRRGEFYSTLNHRPAAINQRVEGNPLDTVGADHCALAGAELARIHLAGQDYPGYRDNPRGSDWIIAVRDMLEQELDSDDQQLISRTLQDYQRLPLSGLPQGPIHADLFRDNVLFTQSGLGGILDFDYACNDSYALDVAILINDWCRESGGSLAGSRVKALLMAYQQQRELNSLEIESLPVLLRISVLRFWLSRLYDKVFPLSGELVFSKDPDILRDLLSRLLQQDEQELFIFPT